MKYIFIISILAVFISGCVKVNLLPEDAVKNSFKAGKNLYDESKLKRQGAKKRNYSKQVVVSEYSNREEAESSCLQLLNTKLNTESPNKEPVIVSEKVIVVDGINNKIIECQIVGFVWTSA